ncbi:hypothetical protein NEF87_000089 [Candidatus Lokiarchaeum ossiferum]|uniref:PIN domain-containing protein n=1 Tax=Candidatus Lokiarchaeum ossiferum TaxID=2951803 RepID=A0ABY6HMJ7_9ARCH|nr:hypothetical protein NEF87_000089 [Candidatus Lokiarchaeum sp. B-35]
MSICSEFTFCLENCHVLEKLSKNSTTTSFLQKLNVPKIIIKELFTLSLPQAKINLYEHQYGVIQGQHPYRKLPFALDDWILAYLAAENQWGAVSLDHHILADIHKYLAYDAFWPEDIASIPADAFVLLDSNILLHFCDHSRSMRSRIETMFLENSSVTFIVSDNIIKEIARVYHRKFERRSAPIQRGRKISNIKQADLGLFIDDFSRFESGKERKKRKREKRKNNPAHNSKFSYPRYSKWNHIVEIS